MNTANLSLSEMLEAATRSDIARAAANATREDPTTMLAYVVVGMVVLFAAFAGAAVFAKRTGR